MSVVAVPDDIPENLAGIEEILGDQLEALVQMARDTHRLILAVRQMRTDDRPAPVLR